VWDWISNERVGDIVCSALAAEGSSSSSSKVDVNLAALKLVNIALQNGSTDNCTAVVIKL
jgi:serine/threonine protein phosphatase PrpC